MFNVTPPVPFSNAPSAPSHVGNCAIFDASSLLYQPSSARPALRAAVAQEQAAVLATRLAVARWTSGIDAPLPPQVRAEQPLRAAFYAQAQEDFFAWIARGGVWEPEHDCAPAPPGAGSVDNAAVK